MKELAWIGLGGNLGDVAATLASARKALRALATDGALVESPIWESQPWGAPGQPSFLNQVLGLRPDRGPREALRSLLAIEAAHGRARSLSERWGPRTLDLDLLSWPGVTMDEADLSLPHPRLASRRFVLAPWADVAPDLELGGRTVAALLADCADPCWVRRCS